MSAIKALNSLYTIHPAATAKQQVCLQFLVYPSIDFVHYLPFTKLPPKYIPIIADTKLVSSCVITKPWKVIHSNISLPSFKNQKPGFQFVYPTVTDTSG